jgi:hypothetical protein
MIPFLSGSSFFADVKRLKKGAEIREYGIKIDNLIYKLIHVVFSRHGGPIRRKMRAERGS